MGKLVKKIGLIISVVSLSISACGQDPVQEDTTIGQVVTESSEASSHDATDGQENAGSLDLTYEEAIFGPEIISIEIIADEAAWQDMLDHASEETYISVDVVVNGTLFENVGIRPKGNSSLSQVVREGGDRYSFRLQFDEYVEGQTCFGLDTFVLNNMIGDPTYLKEYVSYDIMKVVGVATPYYGFADISLNGEYWGFYLAIELYRESYEERVFGDTKGELYNVKSAQMNAAGKGGMDNSDTPEGFQLPEEGQLPEGFQLPEDGQMPIGLMRPGDGQVPDPNNQDFMGTGPNASGEGNTLQRPDRAGGGFPAGMGSVGGGSLEYTDDQTGSYTSIFDNAVGKVSEEEMGRVIDAIRALNTGESLEAYWDTQEVLKYLAAHTAVVNMDSYSSGMAQNYYIYEKGGILSVLPWDYNYGWGAFQMSGASSVVNFPIDSPVRGVAMESRPLYNTFLSDEAYLDTYHNNLGIIVDQYLNEDAVTKKIDTLYALIKDHVARDLNGFYSPEAFEEAVIEFKELLILRGESIKGQLGGEIPSTTEGQSQEGATLVDSSLVTMDALGGPSMGGGYQGGFRVRP